MNKIDFYKMILSPSIFVNYQLIINLSLLDFLYR